MLVFVIVSPVFVRQLHINWLVYVLLALVAIIFGAVITKRSHDFDARGWVIISLICASLVFAMLALVTFPSIFPYNWPAFLLPINLYVLLMPGTQGINRFG